MPKISIYRAILTPDVLNPNAQPDACCALEPLGATGVMLGIAGLFLGAAIAPEVGIGVGILAALAAGYNIYGEGVASGSLGGGGGDLLQ